MSKLDRLSKLDSAKVTDKSPKPMDLSVLVKELQAITMAQEKSQSQITAAIDRLSKVVMMAADEGFDVNKIVEAITGLKEKMAEKRMPPMDYRIDFDRDGRTGLMKSGIELISVPKKLN